MQKRLPNSPLSPRMGHPSQTQTEVGDTHKSHRPSVGVGLARLSLGSHSIYIWEKIRSLTEFSYLCICFSCTPIREPREARGARTQLCGQTRSHSHTLLWFHSSFLVRWAFHQRCDHCLSQSPIGFQEFIWTRQRGIYATYRARCILGGEIWVVSGTFWRFMSRGPK